MKTNDFWCSLLAGMQKYNIFQINSYIAGTREWAAQQLQLLDNVYDNLLSLSKIHLSSAQAN